MSSESKIIDFRLVTPLCLCQTASRHHVVDLFIFPKVNQMKPIRTVTRAQGWTKDCGALWDYKAALISWEFSDLTSVDFVFSHIPCYRTWSNIIFPKVYGPCVYFDTWHHRISFPSDIKEKVLLPEWDRRRPLGTAAFIILWVKNMKFVSHEARNSPAS